MNPMSKGGAAGHFTKRSVSVGEDIFNREICLPGDARMNDAE